MTRGCNDGAVGRASEPASRPSGVRRAAVLGSPVEHSLSPVLHNAGYAACGLSDWEYTRHELSADDCAEWVRGASPDYVGFSVTMPNKFAALELAVERSERAQRIGAANTLVRIDGGWRADNTDVDGVIGSLRELSSMIDTARALNGSDEASAPHPDPAAGAASTMRTMRRAVVIGGGGTARPALVALADAGVNRIDVVNRTDKSADFRGVFAGADVAVQWHGWDSDVAALCAAADVVVSTVPSHVVRGREADIARAPLVDVIYSPWPTPLVEEARRNGIPAVGGLTMLTYQAFGQFEQFTGAAAPKRAMVRAVSEATGVPAADIASAVMCGGSAG